MKIYTQLPVIGGLVVLGATAYLIYRKKRFLDAAQAEKKEPKEPFTVKSSDMRPEDAQPEAPASQLHEVKAEAAASVVKRHMDAAETIDASLDAVFSPDGTEKVVTENTEKLDKMGKELDDML